MPRPIGVGSELGVVQDIGFFHGDPHPGNLLKITEGTGTISCLFLCIERFAIGTRVQESTLVRTVSFSECLGGLQLHRPWTHAGRGWCF